MSKSKARIAASSIAFDGALTTGGTSNSSRHLQDLKHSQRTTLNKRVLPLDKRVLQ